MKARPIKSHEHQAELPFAVPLPQIGTIIIMRIEDFRALPTQRPKPQSRPVAHHSELESALKAWLLGNAPAERYTTGAHRDSRGRVEHASMSSIIRAVDWPGRLPERGQRILAGKAMRNLGWRWRYLTSSDSLSSDGRERILFPPKDWTSGTGSDAL